LAKLDEKIQNQFPMQSELLFIVIFHCTKGKAAMNAPGLWKLRTESTIEMK
jgi:hypothetical protein